MHTCSFCKDPVPPFDAPREAHLVIAKDKDGHIHTHGDLDKKEHAQEMIDSAAETLGLALRPMETSTVPKEVVFHNRQRIGDILMFTCGVRDFKAAFPNTRVNVISTCSHIWDNNPAIDRTLVATDLNTIKIGPSRGTNQSNRLDWHFANAYRISMEDNLKVRIPQGESRPDIWLTKEEYDAPRPFAQPYWIICVSGEKGWGCKMYPFDRWQKVVDQNPELTFVQIGTKGDNPPRLQGPNVIDHVGKTEDKHTGIRDLFKLFLNAEGSIGLVSFHMHLSGALHKPCVVVAGAREPVSFTRYPYHQYIANDGTLPCSVPACWKCNIDACTNLVLYPDKMEKKVPRCADMIEPEEITQAIKRYYKGGRLKLGTPIEKPKLKNIVATPVATAPLIDFNDGSIDPMDWIFMEEIIRKHQVKTILEFGAGLSTLKMSELAHVTSYETEMDWIEKISAEHNRDPKNRNFKLRHWSGVGTEDVLGEFDLAFVDGPANGQNRAEATRLAANHAKIVVVHDSNREAEIKHQEKYLKPGFLGPFKGGRGCSLWMKAPNFVAHPVPPRPSVRANAKTIKIISTARGWGGAQRSVTTIMKMLLDKGHQVEFIPFRNKVTSKEYLDSLKNGLASVRVREDYAAISEPCDVLLCYADDYVWEFPTPEMATAFGGLKARRKVMMVNYRLGRIGEVSWTKGWDRYLFLNSGQEKDLLKILPGSSTGVFPPCTDLSAFFENQPNYELPVRILRHNSQGDTKFPKDAGEEIAKALASRPDVEIHMMPGPSFVSVSERFKKYPKNQPPIPKFLGLGNLFWYSLPKGYMDMGPRVILEAMASGLAVVADNWGGAPDRVTPDCGWICNSKEEMIDVIKNVTKEDLEAKGKAARARALKEFRPERWIEELTGEVCNANNAV